MAKRLTISPKTRPRKPARRARRRTTAWRRHGLRLAVVIVLALVGRACVVQGYRVPSRSMEDTIIAGEYLLVDKATYGAAVPFTAWRVPGWRDPAVGDIVVFAAPQDPGRTYVKRCVAVGGQVVEGRQKVIYVDGRRIVDPPHSKYVDARILEHAQSPRDTFGPVRVPEDAVFLVGDNRDNSRDSRHWGPVPLAAVRGRGVLVYWSCAALRPARAGLSAWLHWLRTVPERVRWERLGRRLR